MRDFETALSNGNWFCRLCICGNILPFNHIDDDNEFMKRIEMYRNASQSPDAAAFRHHNVKIFNRIYINECRNDIDENPDMCHFNEYSHKIFKNCNYYAENSLNKYLLRHFIFDNSSSILH